jgi:acyl-coenzyme A thioesterase PaaI-like protein
MILGRTVPYSGTVSPRVLDLQPGFAQIAIRDRRRIHNHLNSIHAIALANVAELASGLAMTAALPADVRGIVVRLQIDYLRKARGSLMAESRCVIPEFGESTEFVVESQVTDASGDIVARTAVTWLLRR